MPLAVLADAELVVITYLRSVPEVAALVGTKVTADIQADLPRLRVVRLGGSPTVPRRLDAARLQFEARAATRGGARLLAAVAHAAMWEAANATNNGAVITGVEDTLGLQWLPDPVTSAPRYLFGMSVFLHPIP